MAEENIKVKIESKRENYSDKSETLPSPEKDHSFEKAPEKNLDSKNDSEKTSTFTEKISETGNSGQSLNNSSSNNRTKKVEKILEDGLGDLYLELNQKQRVDFRKKGEEVSAKISTLLDSAKVKTKKILNLIKEWLSLLPSVNKFFIEQLAKSKLDEIVKLRNK